MRTTLHHVTALALAGAHLAAGPPAHAAGENQATAAALFEQGKQLMQAGDYANACPKIAEAARLVPTAAKMNRLGDCREHEGKLASAWGAFKQAELIARNADDAEREAEAMRRSGLVVLRLAKLTIVVSPGARVPGLVVRRDDSDVGEGQWGSS